MTHGSAQAVATDTVEYFSECIGRVAAELVERTGCDLDRAVDLAYDYFVTRTAVEDPKGLATVGRALDYLIANA